MFEEESSLFRSIDETLSEAYVEVYAPVSYDSRGQKRRLLMALDRPITDILTQFPRKRTKTMKIRDLVVLAYGAFGGTISGKTSLQKRVYFLELGWAKNRSSGIVRIIMVPIQRLWPRRTRIEISRIFERVCQQLG